MPRGTCNSTVGITTLFLFNMEANEAKKPKRPRIGQPVGLGDNTAHAADNHYENQNFNEGEHRTDNGERPQGGYQPRVQGGYQPRNNYGQQRQQGGYGQQRPYNNRNNQGGYQPRYNNQGQQGGYNRRPGGYNQQRPYNPQPRPEAPETIGETTSATTASASTSAEGAENSAAQQPQQGGYQQRNNYGQQRPYNNRNNQGGYQPRYNNQGQQGGYGQQRPYNNNRQGQGGYNNRNNQGGYQPRYNNQGQQGGYGQQRPYNNRQQGGYNNPQGGYNNRNNQGGYNNRQGQQGGYNNRNNQGGYNNRQGQQGGRFQKNNMRQGKSFIPRPKRVEYEMPALDPDEKIRLNKFMANSGICSRREADEYIQQGLVKVNGEVVTELGTKISHTDTVEYDEKIVALESKCYILLNKPKDCVTTSDDPNGRTTVLDLVKGACDERIYPVGRLDRNTTGVLLLTNDGDLASKLTHPKYVKKKIYHVWTDKDIAEEDMQRIADGIELEDGPIHADAISYATETDRNQAGIEIHSGRNRIVRRIFESLGYHVTKLDRVYFAGLTKKNLPRGRWRYLTQEEVNYLKMGSFE